MMKLYCVLSGRGIGLSLFCGAVALSSSIIGCGMGSTGSLAKNLTPGSPTPATAASGRVHGGNQPITGATVTIYLAGVNTPGGGVTGYGSGSSSLAQTTTDPNGDFNFPAGTYTCPSPSQQAYIVASGGNPGLSGTVNNTNAVLMAALGTCTAGGNLIGTAPFIDINEVTTVAAVWALQQFMASPTAANAGTPNIGAPNTTYSNGLSGGNALSVQSAVVGMGNAFTTANVMAAVSTGVTPNPSYPYAVPESAKINTLADIIAYCINSDPATTTNCSTLLAAATPSGSTTAVDTVQALYYIAQNPTNNLPTLYSYLPSTPPFVPTSAAPTNGGTTAPSATGFNDTTIAINYAPNYSLSGTTTAVVSAPYDVGIDAYGNAWLSNSAYTPTCSACASPVVIYNTVASIAELGPDGNVIVNPISAITVSTAGGDNGTEESTPPSTAVTISVPKSIAIDLTNRAWVANEGFITTGGTHLTSAVGIFGPSSTSGLNGTGGNSTATGYFVGVNPWGLAIDGSNNVYVANVGAAGGDAYPKSLAKMSALDGSAYTNTASNILPGGQVLLAIDANTTASGSGILWGVDAASCNVVGNYYDGSTTTGTTTAPYGYTYYGEVYQFQTSTATPTALSQGLAATTVDAGATVGTVGSAGTPASGIYGTNCGSTSVTIQQAFSAHMANPYGIAIDRYNGVWITNQNGSAGTSAPEGGFDGLTYIVAPTATTGAIASSYNLINGTLASTSASGSKTAAAPGTSFQKPEGIAVDGNNNAWFVSNHNNGIAEASINTTTGAISLLTPGAGSNINAATSTNLGTSTAAAYGYEFYHSTAAASNVAIDPSGNLWIANTPSNTTNAGTFVNQAGLTQLAGNSVTVIVGAAAPVITPKALALKYKSLGQKP